MEIKGQQIDIGHFSLEVIGTLVRVKVITSAYEWVSLCEGGGVFNGVRKNDDINQTKPLSDNGATLYSFLLLIIKPGIELSTH